MSENTKPMGSPNYGRGACDYCGWTDAPPGLQCWDGKVWHASHRMSKGYWQGDYLRSRCATCGHCHDVGHVSDIGSVGV